MFTPAPVVQATIWRPTFGGAGTVVPQAQAGDGIPACPAGISVWCRRRAADGDCLWCAGPPDVFRCEAGRHPRHVVAAARRATLSLHTRGLYRGRSMEAWPCREMPAANTPTRQLVI